MSAEQEALAIKMGYHKCEWPPEESSGCENCGVEGKQEWYIRTCYDVEEGEYHCIDCASSEEPIPDEHDLGDKI